MMRNTGCEYQKRALVIIIIIVGLAIVEDILAKRVDHLTVRTKSGAIRGKRFHLDYPIGKTVDAFLGIPFAKPPIGYLRFRHPQPVEKWNSTYDATKLPNSCFQEPDLTFGNEFYGSTVWNSPTDVSEDCLYLNVFIPKSRNRKLPVMVWIYGGGFYSGTTTLDLYDGKIVAALNDVIFVSIAYRLGALGFLSLDDPSVPGNAGLFDQLMGLNWVQSNIGYFRGDPNNVTLVGESAGSVSVSLHLLSPLSHNKFHRAILQSGTANMPWATLTISEAKRRSLELANVYLTCPKTQDMAELSDCLRMIPVESIVEKQWVSRGILQFPFLPVIDGVFLTAPPNEILERKTFKKCPILLGSNQNEGSFFLIYELKEYLDLTKKSMTQEEFTNSIRQLFFWYPQYPQTINEHGMKAIQFQYTDWLNPNDPGRNVYSLDMAVGDSQFLCPLNAFANAYSTAGQNVFMYYFTERYSSNPWPSWTGVLHGDEIFFSFGEVLKANGNFTEDERRLSKKMVLYWGNFAKTGDPNHYHLNGGENMDEWPLHRADGKEYLELNTRFLDNQDKWKAISRGPRVKECAFWMHYIPFLLNSAGSKEKDVEEELCGSCSALSSSSSSSNYIKYSSHYVTSSYYFVIWKFYIISLVIISHNLFKGPVT